MSMHYLKSTIPSASLSSLAPTEPAPAALLRLAIKVATHFSHSWLVLSERLCRCKEEEKCRCHPDRPSAINGPLSMAQIQSLTFERDPDAWGSSISYPNLCRDEKGRYCYLHETASSRYRVFIRQELDWSFSVFIEIPTLLPVGGGKTEAIGCVVKLHLSSSGEVVSVESFIPPYTNDCGEWEQTPDKRWLISPNGRKAQRTMLHHLSLAEEVVAIFAKWQFPEAQKAVAVACDHEQRAFEAACPDGWVVENEVWVGYDGKVEISPNGWLLITEPWGARGYQTDSPATALVRSRKEMAFWATTESWEEKNGCWKIHPATGDLWGIANDGSFIHQWDDGYEYLSEFPY